MQKRKNCKVLRKSQAALEFLTTYAWAFLVLIISIAALAYFGVLSPKKILPDLCNFGPEIECMQFTIKENGLQLRLKNNAGNTIMIDKLSLVNENSQLNCVSSIDGALWENGGIQDASIYCTGFKDAGIIKDNKEKFNLEVNYNPAQSDASFTKTVSGEVFGVISDGSVFFVPKKGLAGYWKFDDGAGIIAKDSSGNGYDGMLKPDGAGPTWVTGKFGNALSFDGVDDNVLGNAALVSSYPFTLSAWANFDTQTTNGVFVGIYDTSVGNNFQYHIAADVGYFVMRARNPYTKDKFWNFPPQMTKVGTGWHHFLAVFRSATDRELYLDGVSGGTDARSVPAPSTSNQYVMGKNNAATQLFTGKIDEVAIYKRALSDLEIEAMAGVII